MVVNSFISVMSNVQASMRPCVAMRAETVQVVLIGFGGCFLNTLVVEPSQASLQE